VSKYLNETQKTEEWLEQEGLGKRQDVGAIIEELRRPKPANGASHSTSVAVAEPAPTPVAVPLPIAAPIPAPAANGNRTNIASTTTPVVLNGVNSSHYAMEAYRGLRTQLMRLQASHDLRTIAVSSAMPGEGKTTTIVNLGLCYAQLHDMKVLLIDGDLRTKRMSLLFENSSAAGLADVLSGAASYEDAIQSTENPNLYVLTAGQAADSPPELFAGAAWIEFLERCKKEFKMILIDAPPVRPLADFELICAGCDAFMMVVRAYQTQREHLQQIVGQLDSKKLVGVVLNSAEIHSRDGYYYQYGT
jgi:capsular exopolysaccharide synthesis family protein